jgi:hypothetical protein
VLIVIAGNSKRMQHQQKAWLVPLMIVDVALAAMCEFTWPHALLKASLQHVGNYTRMHGAIQAHKEGGVQWSMWATTQECMGRFKHTKKAGCSGACGLLHKNAWGDSSTQSRRGAVEHVGNYTRMHEVIQAHKEGGVQWGLAA